MRSTKSLMQTSPTASAEALDHTNDCERDPGVVGAAVIEDGGKPASPDSQLVTGNLKRIGLTRS